VAAGREASPQTLTASSRLELTIAHGVRLVGVCLLAGSDVKTLASRARRGEGQEPFLLFATHAFSVEEHQHLFSGCQNRTKYDYDADVIAFTNQRLDGLLVPCIKMLKAWGRNVASQLRSYHLEVLALVTVPHVLALLDRMGSARKWPAILAGVFEFLDLKIQYDVRIDGSLSEPPDYYLGTPERMAAIDAAKLAARTAAYARTLSDADAIAAWRGIFGDPFPRGDV
jgi:hypothetical protein